MVELKPVQKLILQWCSITSVVKGIPTTTVILDYMIVVGIPFLTGFFIINSGIPTTRVIQYYSCGWYTFTTLSIGI